MTVTKVVRKCVKSPGYAAFSIDNLIYEAISELNVKDGVISVYTPSKGCAIVGIEEEPNLLSDLEELINRWSEKLEKWVIAETILGSSFTLPLVGGRLEKGVFKRVVFIDLSNEPGEKEVFITVIAGQ